MPRSAPALQCATRPPVGTTTVLRPPYTSALGVPGERIAADARLGERGAWRGALPGTGRSLPGVAQNRKTMEIPARHRQGINPLG